MAMTKKTKTMLKNKFLSCVLAIFFGTFFAPALAQEANSAQSANESLQDEKLKITFDKVDTSRFYNKAVLQILNKTTAKSSVIELSVGEKIEIGQLSVKVNKCWQAPLDQKPDSRILLEVFETKSAGLAKRIFFGWMISSSPSISSLEHPIYDVTALSCKNK